MKVLTRIKVPLCVCVCVIFKAMNMQVMLTSDNIKSSASLYMLFHNRAAAAYLKSSDYFGEFELWMTESNAAM